jgi:hypothetical protein
MMFCAVSYAPFEDASTNFARQFPLILPPAK